MSQQLEYTVFQMEAGWMAILASTQGLVGTTLPRPTAEETLRQVGGGVDRATRSDDHFADLVERFRSYFSGGRPSFPDRLDLSGATSFQHTVWEAARLIPYGETRNYGWLAERVGQPRTARAVGQAMGRNPIAIIIPCHRVIASGGKLGGFGAGLAMKRFLLRLEGAAAQQIPGG